MYNNLGRTSRLYRREKEIRQDERIRIYGRNVPIFSKVGVAWCTCWNVIGIGVGSTREDGAIYKPTLAGLFPSTQKPKTTNLAK